MARHLSCGAGVRSGLILSPETWGLTVTTRPNKTTMQLTTTDGAGSPPRSALRPGVPTSAGDDNTRLVIDHRGGCCRAPRDSEGWPLLQPRVTT